MTRQWPCPHCGQRVDVLEDGLATHYSQPVLRRVCPWSGWTPPEQGPSDATPDLMGGVW